MSRANTNYDTGSFLDVFSADVVRRLEFVDFEGGETISERFDIKRPEWISSRGSGALYLTQKRAIFVLETGHDAHNAIYAPYHCLSVSHGEKDDMIVAKIETENAPREYVFRLKMPHSALAALSGRIRAHRL